MAMTTLDKIKNELYPALLSGGISVGLYSLILGGSLSDTIPTFGVDLPAYAAVGGVSVASHIAGTALEDFVLDKIPKNMKYSKAEAAFVKPSIGGLAMYGLSRFGISDNGDTPFVKTFLVGSGSILASDYLFKNAKKF
jgi:hypothetical protein